MRVGDMVKFEPNIENALIINDMKDRRNHGVVLGFSTYKGITHDRVEPLVKVLWNTGVTDWILQKRVEKVEIYDARIEDEE
jgi:hypothetical protein